MPEYEPLTALVLRTVSTLLTDDYERHFRSIFEATVQTLQGLPYEPGEEIRNVFDHCSLAFSAAARAEVIRVQPEYESSANLQYEFELAEGAVYSNLEQARRHLLYGRFFCVQHLVFRNVDRFNAFIVDLSESERESVANEKKIVDDLELKFQDFLPVKIQLSNLHPVLIEENKRLVYQVEEVTVILNGIQSTYVIVRDKFAVRPAT